jgi:pimeloyl-ACP methyl ester carboxylesterase
MSATVTSRDGTTIAYETTGTGPPLILVDGALCYRDFGPSRKLAEQLAGDFTVITYDRRGRGESGDGLTYAVEREVEDLEALIEAAGGSAHVYGISSGAALALDAAQRDIGVERLALYEAPFIVDDGRAPIDPDYVSRLNGFLVAGRPGDAVRLFMRQVGMPALLVKLMRFMPAWPKLKGVAHTLPYDGAVMQGTQDGRPLPEGRWSDVTMPTLVVAGGKSDPWMHHGMRALADALPDVRFETLAGQNHMVKPRALAPVLAEFFAGEGEVRLDPPRLGAQAVAGREEPVVDREQRAGGRGQQQQG